MDTTNHYEIVPHTHRSYRQQTKGKVERMVRHVKDNFLNGRHFADLQNLNSQARIWLEQIACCRIHQTTQKHPCGSLRQETLIASSSICQYRWIDREPRMVTHRNGIIANSPHGFPSDRTACVHSDKITFLPHIAGIKD